MMDLHVEIRSNIDLVTEKRRMQASDTNQFIRVLCEDVRQFIVCMSDEMRQVQLAMEEREEKCKGDISVIDGMIEKTQGIREEIMAMAAKGDLQTIYGTQERKEVAKVETLKEHSTALRRHMDNTSAYLRKEYYKVNDKITEAKLIMQESLGVNIDNFETELEEQEEAKLAKDLVKILDD